MDMGGSQCAKQIDHVIVEISVIQTKTESGEREMLRYSKGILWPPPACAQNACTHGINKLKVSGKGRALQEVAGVGFERICECFLQIRGG